LGRNKKAPGEAQHTPIRKLGRVDDETWETLRLAAKKQGMTFTKWAVQVLLKAAKKQTITKKATKKTKGE
jgi:predicted HicB family RNase H-like nuclease